ncbi:hypothetical protein AaE_010119, partial [Aphanomyces astaci]
IQFPTEDDLLHWVDHLHNAIPSLPIQTAASSAIDLSSSPTAASSTTDALATQYLRDEIFRASVHRIHRWIDDATAGTS